LPCALVASPTSTPIPFPGANHLRANWDHRFSHRALSRCASSRLAQIRSAGNRLIFLSGIAGILLGFLRGGRLANLGQLELRGGLIGLVALVVQLIVIFRVVPNRDVPLAIGGALIGLSYVALLVVIWCNRFLPGMWIVGIGICLNLLAAVPQGGLMPTTLDTLRAAGRPVPEVLPAPGERPYVLSKDVVLPPDQIPLWLISDRFVIPRGLPFAGVFSPGDVAVAGGLAWLVAQGMVDRRTRSGAKQNKPLSGYQQ
jgi:hypothetical protein